MPRQKKDTKEQQPAEAKSVAGDVLIKLSPVQHSQLEIIASVLNNESVEAYAKKVLQQHIVDRLYLVRK